MITASGVMGEECARQLDKELRSAGIAVSYGSISVYVDERTRMRRHICKRDCENRFMGTSCKSEPEMLKQCIRGSDRFGAWTMEGRLECSSYDVLAICDS